MEWKIGEIKQVNGEWYQCVEQPEKYDKTVCALCAFQGNGNCELDMCSGTYRSDKKSVIFKKLEKAGEPFTVGRELCQHYKVFDIDNVCGNVSWNVHNYKAKTILIELKQNKENMEEGNNTKHTNSENIGKKLKPFDLQAAKSGKPVCTRDGRKARIICFAQKDIAPIVGLVTGLDGKESIYAFYKDGRVSSQEERVDDLMMLPEKKEGWVNVYKGNNGISKYDCDDIVFNTKEEAIQYAQGDNKYITTVKIPWEE